jgi:hypothetical protein
MNVVIIPGQIKSQGIGVPSRQALNPSITETIGFREYMMRYVSGIDDAE